MLMPTLALALNATPNSLFSMPRQVAPMQELLSGNGIALAREAANTLVSAIAVAETMFKRVMAPVPSCGWRVNGIEPTPRSRGASYRPFYWEAMLLSPPGA
jgi:hypothetical protein